MLNGEGKILIRDDYCFRICICNNENIILILVIRFFYIDKMKDFDNLIVYRFCILYFEIIIEILI